jgi:hypothetical protein
MDFSGEWVINDKLTELSIHGSKRGTTEIIQSTKCVDSD